MSVNSQLDSSMKTIKIIQTLITLILNSASQIKVDRSNKLTQAEREISILLSILMHLNNSKLVLTMLMFVSNGRRVPHINSESVLMDLEKLKSRKFRDHKLEIFQVKFNLGIKEIILLLILSKLD